MTASLNGFTVGQRVIASLEEFEEGPRPGVILALDPADSTQPYRILFDEDTAKGEDYGRWPKAHEVSALVAAQPRRLEYRKRFRDGTNDIWQHLPIGGLVSVTNCPQIEVREAPQHTEAEILAKARAVAEAVYSTHSPIRQALRGEF